MEGAQLEDPEVLPSWKEVSHLLARKIFLCYFLYYHYPEITVKSVPWLVKVLVY